MAAVNQSILHVWELGTTGLDGNMTATLYRYPSGTSRTTATETVTIAEIGSTGAYTFTYTPENAQTYVLEVTESTTFAETSWEDIVSDAPSTATASNSYCTEADVDAFASLGDFTASTIPTETEVLGFMEKRAAEVYGRLALVLGDNAPGPSGYDTTIDTTTDKGRALSRAARLANALGAAADALESAGVNEGPRRTERVAELFEMYRTSLDELSALAKVYRGYAGMARNHYDEGRVTKGTFTSATESGLTFNAGTKW